jgi:hypothetical protein
VSRKPVRPPSESKKREATRAVVEALAQSNPITGGLARIYQTTHPSKSQQDQKRWVEEITETTNSISLDLETQAQAMLGMQEKSVSLSERLGSLKEFAEGSRLPTFPQRLIDDEIEKRLGVLRQARFFQGFDRAGSAVSLGKSLQSRELASGSQTTRHKALAWCARILSTVEDKADAVHFLGLSKELGTSDTLVIAAAFLEAAAGDISKALQDLSQIDTPSSRTASFQVVRNFRGAKESIDWLSNVGFSVEMLDPDGKFAFLQVCLELSLWDKAFEVSTNLLDEDFENTPALHQLAGMTALARTVDLELRPTVLTQLPLNLKAFPLASTIDALALRKRAVGHFNTFSRVATSFGCKDVAKFASDLALWLELRDEDTKSRALAALAVSLKDKEDGLRRVLLALDFGIRIDNSAIEKEITRQSTLCGGVTVDIALARLALALNQPSALEAAQYFETHRESLLRFLNKDALASLEIQMLVQSGAIDQAQSLLETLHSQGLDDVLFNSLKRLIAEYQGADPVAVRRSQFESTGSINDLALLIEALHDKEEWTTLANYAETLFQRTGAVRDAESYAVSLFNSLQDDRLDQFIRSNLQYVAQSSKIAQIKCLLLFRNGELVAAKEAVAGLRANQDSLELRRLRLNVAISSGDWDTINSLVAEDWERRDERSAQELLSSAQIGFVVQSPQARELLFEAANRGRTDAHILIGAYSLATNAGMENDRRVAAWFAKGIELSGPDGPVEKATLKDLFDRKPEWDRREADTWRMLTEGAIATFMVARLLRRTLVDLFLRPALANLAEVDPRKRGIIAAFAGTREVTATPFLSTYGFDPTSLFTLSILGVLDEVIETVPQIRIPHSTMGWLLQEKERADFHQPSRIRDAKKLRTLVSTGKLHIFDGDPTVDANLLAEVDDDLAALISECLAKGEDGALQKLVVRPFPVHKIGSLMEEPANLENYEQCLCSCLGLLKKLKSKGLLTKQETDDSFNYLASVDKAWPNEGEINDGAIVFLDDLSVSYLAHTNLLGRLKDASLKAFISKRAIEEADSLIGYEDFSAQVSSHLGGLRKIIAAGIKTGKVQLGKLHAGKSDEQDAISSHPSVTILNLSDQCDALVIDDRFFNKFALNELAGKKIPILTSLELLESLHLAGHMSLEKVRQLKTRLRRANFIHVPIEEDELMQYISECEVRDGKLLETAELRIFRECLQRTKMSDYVKLPEEATWLNRTSMSIISAIRGQWHDECQEEVAQARSSWLVELLDVRGWSSAHGLKDDNRMFDQVFGTHIFLMMIPPRKCSEEIKVKYWSWLEELLLKPLRANQPSLYSWLLEAAKNEIAGLVGEHSGVEGKE